MKKYLLFVLVFLVSNYSFAIGPIVLDSSAGSNMTICIGEPTFYRDSTPGGIWSSSDTLIAKVDTSGTATGISTGTVTITYSIGASYATKTVTVYPSPSPIYGSPNICVSGWTTLYDSTAGGGVWMFGSAGAMYLSYENSYSAIIYPGNLWDLGTLTFVDTAGCSASTFLRTVNPLPPISGVTTIYVGETTTLSDFELGVGTDTWSSSDSAIATIGETTGVVTGISVGTVTINCLFGCMTTTNFTVLPHLLIPVQSTVNVNTINIFPNPATTSVTIQSTNQISQLTITNIIGQTVYSQTLNAEKAEVDVSGLPAGVYFVKVNDSDPSTRPRMTTRKFVKE